jgi:hypothetical protein
MSRGFRAVKKLSGSVVVVAVVISLLHVTPVSAVLGDLNRDGRVDIDDFFLFVGNFGKTGPPEPTTSLRFDGAYWRIDAGTDSPNVEWLRFAADGSLERLRTDVFSPGAVEGSVSAEGGVWNLATYTLLASKVSFSFYEVTSSGQLIDSPYELDLIAGDRLVSVQSGYQHDFMAFRETIPSADFLQSEQFAPDTVETVVRDTIELVVRDTIRVPDTSPRLNDGLRDDWVTYLYQFSSIGFEILEDWETSPGLRRSCCLGSAILDHENGGWPGKTYGRRHTAYVGPIDVSVETKWISGDPGSYGFEYYASPSNGSAYKFLLNPSGRFAVLKYAEDGVGSSFLVDWASSPVVEASGTNELRITADNGRHQFFINGVRVAEARDPDLTLSRGQVRLFVLETKVEFDNLRIGITPFGIVTP